MQVNGRITNPTVKVIRTNNAEGVESSQKVIVAKITMHYSQQLLAYIGENADEPQDMELNASQLELEGVR